MEVCRSRAAWQKPGIEIESRTIARDPENDYGYQSIEFIGDDLALVAYHTRDGINVARIGIDWFYGK